MKTKCFSFGNRTVAVLFFALTLHAWAQTGPADLPPSRGSHPRGIPGVVFDRKGIQALTRVALVQDAHGTCSATDILARLRAGLWTPLEVTHMRNFSAGTATVWLCFNIVNGTEQGSDSFLEVGDNNLQDVQVTVRRELPGGQERLGTMPGGFRIPWSRKPIPMARNIFNTVTPPYSTATVMVRIGAGGIRRVALGIHNTPGLFSRMEFVTLMDGLLIGSLLALLCINLCLFLVIRQKVYLWFVANLVLVCFYVLVLTGHGDRLLWPGAGGLQYLVLGADVWLLAFTIWFFLGQLLDIPSFRRPRTVILGGMVAGSVLSAVAWIFLPAASLFVIPACVALGFAGIIAWGIAGLRARHRDAPVFMVCGMLIAAGGVGSLSTVLGGLDGNPLLPLVSRGDFAGLLGACFLMSFWLLWRLHLLRREKEEAVAVARLKQAFFANVSHEMRTPLNVIMGISEGLDDSRSLQALREGNRCIREESERLLFQINQVLDLTKLEAHRLSMENRPFEPRSILGYLESAYRPRAEARGLGFLMEGKDAGACLLKGDPRRIEQVLRNLIDNAVKYTVSGGIHVEFRIQGSRLGLVETCWLVRDTGPGIPADRQGEIFHEFVQLDPAASRRHGGTGLGTAIVHSLVTAMGGEVFLDSEPGRGSTFGFTLLLPRAETGAGADGGVDAGLAGYGVPAVPASPGPEATLDPDRGMPSTEETGAAKPRILVVDDYQTNLEVARLQLEHWPVQVDTAPDGPSALEKLHAGRYCLVFMDVFMPGLSGYDVVRAMKADPALADIPVVGLTASGQEEDMQAAMQAGMDEVLVKPVRRSALGTILARHCPEAVAGN